MEQTIKYKITALKSATRNGEDQPITIVQALNKETKQSVEFIDFELSSMRLGDELEITVKNNEH